MGARAQFLDETMRACVGKPLTRRRSPATPNQFIIAARLSRIPSRHPLVMFATSCSSLPKAELIIDDVSRRLWLTRSD